MADTKPTYFKIRVSPCLEEPELLDVKFEEFTVIKISKSENRHKLKDLATYHATDMDDAKDVIRDYLDADQLPNR